MMYNKSKAAKHLTTATLKEWVKSHEADYKRLTSLSEVTANEDKFIRKYEDRVQELNKRES